jgi:hypothetical protein
LSGDLARQLHRLTHTADRQDRQNRRHKLVLRLGRVHYDLAPGSSSLLRVKLAARTRRLADRKGRLNVLALASTGPAGDIVHSSRYLTLALRSTIESR